jgi:hypothetical protein
MPSDERYRRLTREGGFGAFTAAGFNRRTSERQSATYPLVSNPGISPTQVGLRLSERQFIAADPTSPVPYTGSVL